ncbi:MAG: hypothetical protein OSJ63_07460 [Bacilli bacterium]|nr:hypothetical protein [Bacilli bacterium]
MENKLVIVKDNKIQITDEVKNYYRKLAQAKLEFDLMDKEFKSQLKSAMELTGQDKLILDGFSAKIKAGYTTKRFDSKRFEKECPDIYKEYVKESSVSSSISIEVE